MLHRTRALLVRQRTMTVNALRAHLAEFGIVTAKGIGQIPELVARAFGEFHVTPVIPAIARSAMAPLVTQISERNKYIGSRKSCSPGTRRIRRANVWRRSPALVLSRRQRWLPQVADPLHFKSGRQFAAWLGLTPRQNSSGRKDRLGSISKMGDRYLRTLLIIGATGVMR